MAAAINAVAAMGGGTKKNSWKWPRKLLRSISTETMRTTSRKAPSSFSRLTGSCELPVPD